jgi:hypothetical protein
LRPLSLSLAALAALIAPALALGQGITTGIAANLDADALFEEVIPQEVCTSLTGPVGMSACGPDQYPQRRIVVVDTCNGAPHPVVVSSVQDTVDSLRVANFDGRKDRPEIFYDMRSGASGRVGETRVLRWQNASAGACPAARTLFLYPSRKTRGRVPRGARYHDNYSARLNDFSKRYRGEEIRLTETYVDRNDPFCCPSFKRTTYFRYSAARDAYRRYATQVKRIKK